MPGKRKIKLLQITGLSSETSPLCW